MEQSGTIANIKLVHNKTELIHYIRVKLRNIPWWLVGIILIALLTAYVIVTRESFRNAFLFIRTGLAITITTTVISYLIAVTLGLLTGLGRISSNTLFRNLATMYVEIVRGIPMLVLIFFIAFVGVPGIVDGIKSLGTWCNDSGLTGIGSALIALENNAIPMNTRAVIALSVTYGAFLAEIFRAGIQSIGRGQMEAARSQGMTYWQAMRFIILPQAIRNVLPALGNDFISMLKDSSLVSVLAVRDITQIARLYAGRSFQFRESYLTLAVLYLTMTVFLSMVMKLIERRIQKNEQA
ncbi:MAG: amino acid ABC transporter permease [Anaerolineaceae bacterium]|nr:amino acid ABC transporter permease [Anaerolineaceae bacterium]MBN2677461.1 amino acid ABC transporter permease [Anaerolineaceae bacterium]